ncbi:uncharacterized protein A4U43_C08F5110 [Asparagus officinalis]|nr:uncharacterized protein A4U43_C08F5110 [Asparagus officinalis]
MADMEAFLKLAHKLGFLVMLRPGPYICGEWDLGGFPSWLLSVEPAIRLRSSDPSFLQLVERWWGILLPKVAPLLYENGGPVVMVQVENEFGSYGDDKAYLHQLVALARKHLGDEIILYTTDGGTKDTLDKGTIPGEGVYAAVDFSTGEDPWPIFELQKKYNAPGKSPPLSAEFYTGWLTHWGEKNAETNADTTAAALQKILSRNGSAVLYMAHGGTNFGFSSGANTGDDDSDYKPDLTSYDYDAPIREFGGVDNPKFKALRRVIEKYSDATLPQIPSENDRTDYGLVEVKKTTSLFGVLDVLCDPVDVVQSEEPMTMESIGQMFGFLLYVSEYSGISTGSILSIPKVHDRAQVFVSCASEDGESPRYVGSIERWSNRALVIPNIKCSSNISLHILVENMGHINYGQYMYDKKGILSSVTVDGIILRLWKMYPITVNNLNNLFKDNPIMQVADSGNDERSTHHILKDNISPEPRFYEGRLFIDSEDQIKDTFISFHGWNKGVAFVNNFNIGRFWPTVGPQCNLYVPAPILRLGENVVVILELHAPKPDLTISFVKDPDFTCGSS